MPTSASSTKSAQYVHLYGVVIAFHVLLWISCFALFLNTLNEGHLIVPLAVTGSENAEGYPRISSIDSEFATVSELSVGDSLLMVGDAELVSVGTPGFYARVREQGRKNLRIPILFEHAGRVRETTIVLHIAPIWWEQITLALSFAMLAGVLFARARRVPEARILAIASVWYSLRFMILRAAPSK